MRTLSEQVWDCGVILAIVVVMWLCIIAAGYVTWGLLT